MCICICRVSIHNSYRLGLADLNLNIPNAFLMCTVLCLYAVVLLMNKVDVTCLRVSTTCVYRMFIWIICISVCYSVYAVYQLITDIYWDVRDCASMVQVSLYCLLCFVYILCRVLWLMWMLPACLLHSHVYIKHIPLLHARQSAERSWRKLRTSAERYTERVTHWWTHPN